MPDPAVWLEAGAEALLYASLLIVIGAGALRWLLLPRCRAELDPLGSGQFFFIEKSIARLALVASGVALAACFLRAWTHTVSAFGFGDVSWENLRLIAFESRWGQSWRLQSAAALLLVVAFALVLWRRAAWTLAALASLVFTATIPLLGHAAPSAFREWLHAVHILAAGFWLGTLVVVLLVRLPAASGHSSAARLGGRGVRLLILRRFWPLAMPSAAMAVIAGVVAAYVYVGAFSNLWTTAYGRLLLGKVALVGGISVCGYLNWRHLRRLRVLDESSVGMIVLEAVLAVLVVLVTGLLTETGHPG